MNTNASTYWFVFVGNSLLLSKDGPEDSYSVPLSVEPPFATKSWTYIQELPDLEGHPCRAYSLTVPPTNVDNYDTVGLRESYDKLPANFFEMAGKASELLYWNSNTQYCGVCGAPMRKQTEISKCCTNCGKEVWPQVSPAIIVRIRKAATPATNTHAAEPEQILLVHARNFRRSEMYGLVAGFLETGETLEECVRREVAEEVGLTIANIRYFGSQPWPFPCGVMIAYTADYAGGEIKRQDEELSDARWFSADRLPQIPDKMSIARALIDDWMRGQG